MKLSQPPFSRPNALERSLKAEVENLRLGLESLAAEPALLNEVALCLAYLSLGEHGRAGVAFALVQEYRSQLDAACRDLSAVRKESFESLLRRIEVIAHIQATRNTLQSAMQFHCSHHNRPIQMGGTRMPAAA